MTFFEIIYVSWHSKQFKSFPTDLHAEGSFKFPSVPSSSPPLDTYTRVKASPKESHLITLPLIESLFTNFTQWLTNCNFTLFSSFQKRAKKYFQINSERCKSSTRSTMQTCIFTVENFNWKWLINDCFCVFSVVVFFFSPQVDIVRAAGGWLISDANHKNSAEIPDLLIPLSYFCLLLIARTSTALAVLDSRMTKYRVTLPSPRLRTLSATTESEMFSTKSWCNWRKGN